MIIQHTMSDKQDSKKVLKKENERTRMNGFVVSIGSVLACAIIFHSGRTDEWGGHYDHSTGEYHYHHGYPAHDHYDIDGDGTVDCPYKFDDNTIHKNPKSSENKDNAVDKTDKPSTNNKKAKIAFNDILEVIFASFCFYIIGLFFCELVVIPLIDWLTKKLTKSELMISESEKLQKFESIVIGALSLVIATFLMLRDKGVL